MEHLDADSIRSLLASLGAKAWARGLRIELAIAGGAAIALLLGRRRTTKDVDAVVLAPGESAPVRALAAEVAVESGVPEDWLNDGVKGYLHGLALGRIVLDQPGILVKALASEQLLAMKLSAWRDDVDIDDALALLSLIEGEKADVWTGLEPFLVPGRELKARYAFDDLWESRR